MNAVLDLIPAILFFAAYKFYDLFVATAVLVVALLVMVGFTYFRTGKVPKLQLAVAGVAVVMGGLTLYFHNATFILYKPTVLYGAFSLALLASHVIGDRVILQRLPQKALVMPDRLWRRVNFAWALFFAFCAVLNIYVALNYSEDVWVKVKAFGFTALMFVFMLAHIPFLSRHFVDPDAAPR
ncbi:septation protein IspZ [Nevskia sp.]|uniref:septation protein IspZ n=1 Tax=Nevskia sp. TaxID=1929292 RepID=UPI0025EC2D63|nr:septation protein IspZ [Nevskia sp.]